MYRLLLHPASRFALIISSFVFLAGLALPRMAYAHGGHPLTPEIAPDPTPDVIVSASPGGDHRVYVPVIIAMGEYVAPPETQDAHIQNDYDLAEAARKRNEPVFELPTEKIMAAEAPGDLITLGEWGPITTWPFVFVSAVNLPDGRILTWGGNNATSFNGGTSTFAGVWDPNTNQITSNNNNNHSMFCAIPTMLEDGRVFANGGDGTRERTSTFDYRTNAWTRINDMNTGRWYNGAVALPNGAVFTAVGDPGGPNPELWTEGQGWSLLTGASMSSITGDPSYQSSWLPYLHLAPNGKIFHSGPTAQMNWMDLTANGSVASAGPGMSWYPKYSVGIMYDEGKILVAGGAAARNPGSGASTNQAAIIALNTGTATTTTVAPMANARKFPSSVMLPTGEVLVIGGNTSGGEFSDVGSILPSEIWNPISQSWRTVASISVPRNYHSVALLMADGRVFNGGGGLCACSADHPDHQIYSPGYLFNADGSLATRPTISAAPNATVGGRTIAVTASTGIQKFSLIKMSGTTHDLNSDLRFLNVPFTADGAGGYQLTLHANVNVLTPGYWMLFALNAQGVPSVAKVIQIVTSNAPRVANPGSQSSLAGDNVNLSIAALDPNGDALTFSASGLPAGLAIAPSTGLINGAPTTPGIYPVTVNVSDGSTTVPVAFSWSVTGAGQQPPKYRYVRLVATSEINGNPWTSAAEVNVLDAAGTTLSRTGWVATADSQETAGEPGQASNAIDGNTATIWHTQWQAASPPPPHWLSLDMGVANTVGGFKYLPRSGGGNGTIAGYGFYVSTDGVNWGNPVTQGTFANSAAEKTVTFNLTPNTPPTLAAIANQTNIINTSVNLPLSASDTDGDALSFSASGLPTGLTINSSTGVIAGTPSATGSFAATVTVQDGRGGSASRSFVWVIQPAPLTLTLNPINSLPRPVNTAIDFVASSSNGVNPRYKWLWGDGSAETAYATSPNASHSFAAPGLYNAKLTATDDNGVEKTQTWVQAVHLPSTANRPNSSMNLLYEARASGNPRVWVVNQDNDSVSVFDATTNAKLAEINVGVMPRSIALAPNGNVWVTNKGAASISIISPSTLAVAQTVSLPYASQPFGVAFVPAGTPTGGSAFVALEAIGTLLKLDASSGAQTGSLVVGPNVRGVAVSADGASVLVSRFVTPRLPGEETANVQPSTTAGGEVVVVNASAMSVVRTVVLQHSDKPDTEVQGSGIPNYVGAVAISPDGVSAWAPSKQDNVKRGILRNGNGLNFQNSVRAIISRIDLSVGNSADDLAGRIDHDNSSVSSAAVFDRYGSYLFTALETSREVAVSDAYSKREIWRFGVGRAPQGLAISSDGLKLYVNNFMDRSVQIFDLSALMNRGEKTFALLATYSAVATEKLTAQVLNGKQLFYDAKDTRLARDGYLSCASCHNDGGQDGRVWDFTGFGEGLRNTVQLRGRSGAAQGFLHWSANFDEVQDFEGQIRTFAGGTGLMTDAQFNTGTRNTPLGDAKAGVSTDLDALAAYLASLNSFALSPFRNSDGSLTADATAGKTVFQSANCAQCHGGTAFSSSGNATLFNIGTLKASSGQRLGAALNGIDPPTLRDVWATGPYLHDGSAATLNAAVSAHNNVTLNATQVQQVVAYLQQIGSLETTAPSANVAPSVSVSAPANNTTFTAPATVAIAATANDSDGTVSKVEFFNGATKMGEDTSAPYSFDWTNVAAGAYTITAKATDNAGATTTSATVNITVNAPPACTLPSGWASQDIGSPGQAGSACESSGAWTVKGGGADIWSSSDQFRFAYQSANAPNAATIIARASSVQNTDVWAKAGVMFRDGTAANARFVMVVQMPNNEVTMQWRTSAGGSASWSGARVGGTASVKWVKLVKSGSSFTAFYSTATGVPTSGQWVQISTARTVTMSNPKPGLAVTAHNNGSLNTSTFTGVTVTSP